MLLCIHVTYCVAAILVPFFVLPTLRGTKPDVMNNTANGVLFDGTTPAYQNYNDYLGSHGIQNTSREYLYIRTLDETMEVNSTLINKFDTTAGVLSNISQGFNDTIYCPYFTTDDEESAREIRPECKVQFSSIKIICVILLVFAISQCVTLFCVYMSTLDEHCSEYEKYSFQEMPKSVIKHKFVLVLATLFHFMLAGFETMYTEYLSAYLVLSLGDSIQPKAYVVCQALYYVFYGFGRIVCGVMLKHMKSCKVLTIMTMVLAATVVGDVCIAGASEILIRFSASIAGFCISTMMTSMMLWMEQWEDLNQTHYGLWIISIALGMIFIPCGGGVILAELGRAGYDYLKLIIGLILLVLCMIMICYEKLNLKCKRQGKCIPNIDISGGISPTDIDHKAAESMDMRYYMLDSTVYFVHFFGVKTETPPTVEVTERGPTFVEPI